jgi:transposase
MDDTTKRPELYLSIELSSSQWKLTFSDGERQRERNVDAGRVDDVDREVGKAKEKLELPADCQVHSCYEAGRDGFWLHRELVKRGVDNLVVDPSAIEMNRRMRQVKTTGSMGESSWRSWYATSAVSAEHFERCECRARRRRTRGDPSASASVSNGSEPLTAIGWARS